MRPIGILAIQDRLVQTLFLLTIDPILDCHDDKSNFGFKKGRHQHQAIGLLSKKLHHKITNKKHNNKKYFINSKHILKIDIQKFFDSVNRTWLLNNYPFPTRFKKILSLWAHYGITGALSRPPVVLTIGSKFFEKGIEGNYRL